VALQCKVSGYFNEVVQLIAFRYIEGAMELRHLRHFVATVDYKSLREASRRIHVAQPAISQAISNPRG
jgi:hypothetical protein